MELNIHQGIQAQAAVVEMSRNRHTNKVLTTFWIRYWRPILAELNTHRMLSKSTGSSRAIPVAKRLADVRQKPWGPIHWGLNQAGMQASQEADGEVLERAKTAWIEAANMAADQAEELMDLGIHKQVANRLLEPFVYVDTVITGTEWDNFYELRDHVDAQPEIKDLAHTMLLAQQAATPRIVEEHSIMDPRDWHLPFVTMDERKAHKAHELVAMSAARCARTSFHNHNKQNPTFAEDDGLYRRLVESRPLHASPLEHQAVVSSVDHRSANLLGGWIQHRFMLEQCGSIDNLQLALTGQ